MFKCLNEEINNKIIKKLIKKVFHFVVTLFYVIRLYIGGSKMNRLSCNIVRDLLPLYCDKVLEEESLVELEKHLKECRTCQEIYEKMNRELCEDCSNVKEVPDIQRLFRKNKNKKYNYF